MRLLLAQGEDPNQYLGDQQRLFSAKQQKDQAPFGLGSLIYRYASNKGRANVVVKYTSPKMRNLAHSNHINKIDQSTQQTLADWPASQFENDLVSARQNIKKELNAFLKDPDTGKKGVVDVYIGDYHLRN